MCLSPFYNVVLESFRSIVIFLLVGIIQFPQFISGLYILRGNHFELVYQVCSVNNRQRIHDFCIQCHLLFAVQPNVLVTGLHKNSKWRVRISCASPLVSRLKNRKVFRRLVIHHLRCPVLIHNLARPGRVILPVTEPFLEILCFRLVRKAIDISAAFAYTVIGNRTTVRFGRIDRGLFTCRRSKVSFFYVCVYRLDKQIKPLIRNNCNRLC